MFTVFSRPISVGKIDNLETEIRYKKEKVKYQNWKSWNQKWKTTERNKKIPALSHSSAWRLPQLSQRPSLPRA